MKKYKLIDDNGREHYYGFIGVHHFGPGCFAGGMISSYQEMFEQEDKVNVQSGFGDIRFATIGNISEAFEILKDVLNERKPETFIEKCECVMETVNRYFGDFSNVQSRLSFFPAEDNDLNDGKISDLAHQNAAICVERSMLSHNLLKALGINSVFKMSGMKNNGKNEGHAFNVVTDGNKFYIYDSTIPTLRDNIISPIVAEIPKEVYDELIKPRNNDGISIQVSHYNPLTDRDYDVVYDAFWPRTYDASNSLEKDRII